MRFLASWLVLLTSGTALLANDPGSAFFEQKIRPVLVEHCYSCHSEKSPKLRGGLRLDTREGWQKGGDSGEAVVRPGKPAESLLIKAVKHEGDTAMPPGKKLPDGVVADLIAWVKMGAPDPRTGTTLEVRRADKTWWSLQPPARTFPHATIDGFIEAKLRARGLAWNPPADPRTLIRRMTYDLHGLPPSPDEVAAFVKAFAGDAEAATAQLVDRLLASPRYGERWGRHWLDVVRFGESNGFERNFAIDNLWPFRDYVIESLNNDKPFNQFLIEHLAGDVVGKGNPKVEVGTAFLVAGPFDDVGNQDPAAQANIRAATLDDVITATGSAFLGLTLNCARCHHHKFDPIPTEDYYRMRAAFEGVTHGARVLASPEQQAAYHQAMNPLNAELAILEAERKSLEAGLAARAQAEWAKRKPSRPRIDPEETEERFAAVEAKQVRFVIHATTGRVDRGVGGRLTEFQVWTSEPTPRNVALQQAGGKAAGARSQVAEDFPEAYGPQMTNDGRFGEQWFIGSPAVLTVTLARPEKIDRITFSNSRGRGVKDRSQGETPCEYTVQISLDGTTWQTVAGSDDRIPWTPAHGVERIRRELANTDEARTVLDLDARIAAVKKRQAAIAPLPTVWAGIFAQPKGRTLVHKGGDPMKPGDTVLPESLHVLDRGHPKPYALAADAPEGERRLALARWMASDDNPLTARVIVNRIWHYHFGTGIVDTPSDFGFLGSQPSHPELLDWLAGRLLQHGWKLKPLHREILLTRTYRQASTYREEAARMDRDARLLWRFPPRRLSAEELRDTMLSLSGVLDLKMGGPGFRLYRYTQNNVSTYFPLDRHGPETYRRAVYHQNARASVVDLLNDFDLPDTALAAPRRANTVSPLQSLTLLNHTFTQDMAQALAGRIERETKADATQEVDRLYALLFQRSPTPKERDAAHAYVRKHGLAALCRVAWNLNELLYLD